MGFTIFSIEANMPEAYALNDYVLNGIGDPKRLLQGMYFWTWNTQEVLDMVLWMREFNASGKGRLQFTGFDMQTGTVAMNIVRNFVAKADPDYIGTLNTAFAAAAMVQSNYSKQISQTNAAIQAATDGVHAVWQRLTERRGDYLAAFPAETVDWAIQNAKVFEQATYIALGGSSYRDQCMAANLEWILQQNPGAKVVVWAHDYHVSRVRGAMGSYVGEKHGADYVVFGQVFHAGGYNAFNSGRLIANSATPSFPGTIEYVLHSTGMPKFMLDLRRASPDDAGAAWLWGRTQYRSIGALAVDGFGFTDQLTADYDVLIFFDQVNPSVLLPFN
jgi:erythromycin esterase